MERAKLKPAELAMVEASVRDAVAKAIPVYNQVLIYIYIYMYIYIYIGVAR